MMTRTTLSLRAAVTTDPRRRGAGQTQKITRMGRGAGRKRGQSNVHSLTGFTICF